MSLDFEQFCNITKTFKNQTPGSFNVSEHDYDLLLKYELSVNVDSIKHI